MGFDRMNIIITDDPTACQFCDSLYQFMIVFFASYTGPQLDGSTLTCLLSKQFQETCWHRVAIFDFIKYKWTCSISVSMSRYDNLFQTSV